MRERKEIKKMLVSFIVFNIINVIIQTVKSIVTIKCNKWVASIVNAVAYGLYTYIVVLTASDLDLWFKIIVTAGANLIGVFVVKWIEEKKRKEMLWKVEFTVKTNSAKNVDKLLSLAEIPHSYIEIGKHTIFNAYCSTSKESESVKEIIKKYNAKYFVSETKIL
jgi:uncharacterized protein YebE (UPF0316 family)